MKRKKFLIFLFLVVSCINENKEIKVGKEENMSETTKISKEYMTLKDFNKYILNKICKLFIFFSFYNKF